jgi:hypothetical protein
VPLLRTVPDRHTNHPQGCQQLLPGVSVDHVFGFIVEFLSSFLS